MTTADLLLGLFKRVRDRRPRRGAHLELRDDAIDALDVGIDGPAVVATEQDGEGDVEYVSGHVMSKLGEALLLLRRGGGELTLPLVRLGQLVIDHGPEYAQIPNLGSLLGARVHRSASPLASSASGGAGGCGRAPRPPQRGLGCINSVGPNTRPGRTQLRIQVRLRRLNEHVRRLL